MPRDYKKQLEWERSRYRQVLFKVDIALADEHREHLAKYGIKPIEWFKYAVSLNLVPPEYATDISIKEIHEKTDIRHDKLNETVLEVEVHEEVKVLTDVKKRRRALSPTLEMVQSWIDMYDDGMSFNAIAAKVKDYEASTIRKRIRMEMAKDES